ncbi:MAG: response regulator [Pseudomonadales bacterium]
MRESYSTVYVVDDDEAVRNAIGMLIESCDWKAALYASTVDFLKDLHVPSGRSCLVLDLNMPGQSGVDLLESKEMSIPVIVVTSHTDSPLSRRALANGALAILHKPFDDKELLQHVRSALALSGSVGAPKP